MLKGLKKLDAICARLQTSVHQTDVTDSAQKEASKEENGNKVTIDNALKNKSKCNDGGGSSRRKSRKNTNPRNIQSLSMVSETDFEKDELSEYEINNRDVDFGPLLQNGVDVEAAVPTDLTLNDSPKENIPNLNNYANQLTKTADQQNAQDSLKQKAVEKYDALNLSKMATEQKPCDTTPNIPDAPRKECVNSADAATLKDYAQDTVNELLSIYGLGNEAEGITESVPLQNFSSRKILERTTPEPKKRGGHHRSSNNYKKFVDSLSRPQLPEGSVIASPPLQLPGNGNSPAEATPGGMPLSLNLTPKSGKKHKYSLSPEKRKGSPGSYSSPGKDDNLPDYAKYLKRFPNHTECGGNHCSDMNYREHYHCLDCSYRVFVKKEEMVRHYKWHKKRDESLQHGFMRYSPLDDCTVKFGSCTHYGKQTHYHCLQSGCDKVYISTSDVQMHANYHRKASAIIQEGFQRFRATEDCGTPLCQFYGQRTTHFHCRRTGCKFTFKNKADMEKHKSYHQKDEILSKDGFKKFMKYETCGFGDCKYSKVSNHIHCIRPGCDYVLHSTGQLYSHKRKHERKDFEMAYQEFRQSPIEQTRHIPKHNPEFVKLEDLAMMDMDSTLSPASDSQPSSMSESPVPSSFNENRTLMSFPLQSQVLNLKKIAPKPDSPTLLSAMTSENQLNDSLNLPIPGRRSEDQGETMKSEKQEASSTSDRSKDESWMEYLMRYTANDHCHSRCEYLYKDHYHCRSEGCNQMFRSKEGVREHARLHKVQDEISGYGFKTVEADETCVEVGCRHEEKHYHCSLATCAAVITLSGPFDRLKHFKTHEVPTKLSRHGRTTVAESLKRKRGRPPKYPKDEIPIVPRPTVTMEDIRVSQESNNDVDTSRIFEGFKLYEVGEQCPDMFCSYFARFRHWHCLQPRCHHATDRLDVMNIHRKDFHNFVFIREGFEFFDRNVNCRRQHCHNNKANRHFHCVRPRCDYSFVRHTTMEQHERRHLANANDTDDTSASAYPQVMQSAVPASQMILIPVNGDIDSKGIVKAAGTFFPQNMIGQPPALNTPQPIQIIQTTAGPIAVTIPSLQAPHSVGIVQPSIIQGQQVVTSSQQGVNTLSSNFNVSDSPQSQMVSTGAGILPLTMLLQQKVHMPKQDWLIQLSKMHYNMLQNCGRPFCKLKKRNHYHCSECNQAFTEEAKIRSHINSKHRGRSPGDEGVDSPAAKQIKLEPTSVPSPVMNASSVKLEVEDESFDASGYNGDESLHMSLDSLDSSTSSVVTKSGRKAKKSWKFIETDPSQPKKSRSPRGERADSNIPAGYTRVRFDENCGEDKCSYRQSQTHYHCVRDDCKYGFSDRSRMLPHTLRHERIDKIMGDDFHQFRGNLDCEHEGCEFRKKSSHFHCLKCDFMCCDTNRVIGHRKHHSKMDGYLAQGFKKTAGIQDCGVDNCIHKHKQTHYHCMYGDCNYAVLTPSQMSPHKFKHDLEAKQAQAAKVMV